MKFQKKCPLVDLVDQEEALARAQVVEVAHLAAEALAEVVLVVVGRKILRLKIKVK